MADVFDPDNPQQRPGEPDFESVPYEQEPPELEEEAPRRAASARYIVDSEVGSEAMLRDAMDPANQSLGEALRLSFRVLQAVIVVLIVLFLASGLKTVDEGYSGVHTVWGAIRAVDGEKALTPGAKFSWPEPIGQYILFRQENRTVDLGDAFAPVGGGRTREAMLERAQIHQPLMPGRDGSLLTREGELAHLEMSAKYEIDDPVEFVQHVNDFDSRRDANEIVRLALQRAAVHYVATVSLPELIESEQLETHREAIAQRAQDVLDQLDSGIRLVEVQGFTPRPPLAIEKALGDLQNATVEAETAVQDAIKRANETLNRMAGDEHWKLTQLIGEYEAAIDLGEQNTDELLASINQALRSERATGEVSSIIGNAGAYRSQVESTLGNEYRRFSSLLPAYQRNPELVVRQEWLNAYNDVLSARDIEVIYVPHYLAMLEMHLSGSAAIQELRRRESIRRREQEANMIGRDPLQPNILRARDRFIGEPGRQLQPDEEGGLRPTGEPR